MTCFDTTILIWGIQGAAKPEQRGMIARTRRFLERLQETGEQVIVPAPVLAEYLTWFEPAQQTPQRKVLETRFRIPAFERRRGRSRRRARARCRPSKAGPRPTQS